MRRINNKVIFSILMAGILIICAIICLNGKGYKSEVMSDDDYIMLNNFTVQADNSEVTLPKSFEYTGEDIVLTKKLELEKDFKDKPCIMMISKYFDYSIYIDDNLVYEYTNPKNGYMTTSGGQIKIVSLGDEINGKTLKMEIKPLLGSAIKYSVVAPLIGSRADILWHSIKHQRVEIIIDILIIIFGMVLLMASIIMHGKVEGEKMFFLGMILILCGIYMGCQYRLTHILIENSYLLCYLEFMMLNMIPIVVSMFMCIGIQGKAKMLCRGYRILAIANILFQNIMNFIFKVEFRLLLPITRIIILLLAASIFTNIILLRRGEKNAKNMLISFVPPITGGIVDLALINASVTEKATFFFPLGMYIFVALQVLYTVRQHKEINKKQILSETHAKLAFKDGLTGLYNRLSFERDLNESVENVTPACISIDLNGLKITNDTKGHSTGDILIKGMAKILRYAVRRRGKIYRIGGDEFIVLIRDISKPEMETLLKDIEECKMKYNAENNANIDFALGVSYYDTADTSLENLVMRADLKMYRDKRKAKEVTEE